MRRREHANRSMRSLLVVLACLAVVAACDQKTGRFFIPVAIVDGLDPTTGDIFGTVTVDGVLRSGVPVTVRRNGSVVDMIDTDALGRYEFLELDPGTYSVSIGTIPGATCPGERTATVFADDETRVDFACTSQPTTGTVTGTVTANGSPVSGATVALGGRTTMTDANGAFTFENVEPGSYGVSASASGFDCQATTVSVTAGQPSTVDIACTGPPAGSDVAAFPYSLMGTIIGTDACGLGTTISNPGPISVLFASTTNTVTIVSDANVAGVYTPGQPWTGTGTTTFSSGGMTFVLRETATGTWLRMDGTIVLPGTLTFEVLQGSTEVCESRYNASYTQLTASSRRFKSEIRHLLPDPVSILGLRPVVYRYLPEFGDPGVLRFGLIAEEVAREFPEAVAVDRAGRAWGIAYDALRPAVARVLASRAGATASTAIERLAEAICPG